jgi:hypothetical protein
VAAPLLGKVTSISRIGLTVIKSGAGFGNYLRGNFDHTVIHNNLFISSPSINLKFGRYSHCPGRVEAIRHFGNHCVFNFNARHN